jgi:hypothetical protein
MHTEYKNKIQKVVAILLHHNPFMDMIVNDFAILTYETYEIGTHGSSCFHPMLNAVFEACLFLPPPDYDNITN